MGLVACTTPLPNREPVVIDAQGRVILGGAIGGAPGRHAPPPSHDIAKTKKFAVALGGGAVKGFAHIGVLQVLEEAGIKVHILVGTSSGSMIAALYAAGYHGQELQQLADQWDDGLFSQWLLSRIGLIRSNPLEKYLRDKIKNQKIEDLPINLGIVATHLSLGEGKLFRNGDVTQAVLASSAVPGLFRPVMIDRIEYLDGGLTSPVPVKYAFEMGADVVMAVDVSQHPNGNVSTDMLPILLDTFDIMGKSILSWELKQAQLVIRPELKDVSAYDFHKRADLIQRGRRAMQEHLPKLRTILQHNP
ncbi:MAG: patatin-like phospholipase family protein [Gammaproteobacteria bacterium]|nr:patatin-like phospholipase family protein [Gammaproteobacteria bacterium]